MQKLLRLVAAVTVSLGFVSGAAAAASSINDTGPDSYNKVKNLSTNSLSIDNDNDVTASNSNHQKAYTGDALVQHNTTGGSATSGDANNDNSFSASVSIDNSGFCGCLGNFGSGADMGGSIDLTGPDSTNVIENKVNNNVRVNNDNDVRVTNTNDQHASSGDATVYGNTTGGDATSGNASNSNDTSLVLSISN